MPGYELRIYELSLLCRQGTRRLSGSAPGRAAMLLPQRMPDFPGARIPFGSSAFFSRLNTAFCTGP